MANVLYLVHRLPYPPDKGDKVRSFHILRHLCEQHRVLLGTFVDDPGDLKHVAVLAGQCQEVFALRLRDSWARLRALPGLVNGQPLSLTYYRDRRMRAWVNQLRAGGRIDAVVVSSSSMAPYADAFDLPVLMDFIDVDSLKWCAYADRTRGLARWVYGREGRVLLDFERRMASRATRSFFVSAREVELFRQLAPESAGRTEVLANGVDADHFCPQAARPSPYAPGEIAIAFTGTMSYRPNVDAVLWFVQDVLPALRGQWPGLRLSVVGRHPAAEIQRLHGADVRVTGAVEDTRPWLQHAAVVVAPMRIARGVQNKVLEAMAMARPVVASSECVQALDVEAGRHLAVATRASEHVQAITSLLGDAAAARRLGDAARRRVRERYTWARNLSPLNGWLQPQHPTPDRP